MSTGTARPAGRGFAPRRGTLHLVATRAAPVRLLVLPLLLLVAVAPIERTLLRVTAVAAQVAKGQKRAMSSETTLTTVANGQTDLKMVLLEGNRYGARCLDGSPPGYFFRRGFGSGSSAWHVYLPYGGWCTTAAQCLSRSKMYLGSSNADMQLKDNPLANASWGYMGVLSVQPAVNPVLFNWNLVVPMYCDGSGFSGRAGRLAVTNTAGVKGAQSGSNVSAAAATHYIYSHGWKIVKAVMADIATNRGFANASRVLLSGASAGAQAVVTLCDQLPAIAPRATTKCLMDSGFFLDALDRFNQSTFRNKALSLVTLHRSIGNPRCGRAQAAANKWRCFFPQYALRYVRSPLFVANSLFDQRALILGNQLNDSGNHARRCLFPLAYQQGLPALVVFKQNSPNYEKIFTTSVDRFANQTQLWCARNEVEAVIRSSMELWEDVRMLRSNRLTAFLPWRTNHCMIALPWWNVFQVNGQTLNSAVEEWLMK